MILSEFCFIAPLEVLGKYYHYKVRYAEKILNM